MFAIFPVLLHKINRQGVVITSHQPMPSICFISFWVADGRPKNEKFLRPDWDSALHDACVNMASVKIAFVGSTDFDLKRIWTKWKERLFSLVDSNDAFQLERKVRTGVRSEIMKLKGCTSRISSQPLMWCHEMVRRKGVDGTHVNRGDQFYKRQEMEEMRERCYAWGCFCTGTWCDTEELSGSRRKDTT